MAALFLAAGLRNPYNKEQSPGQLNVFNGSVQAGVWQEFNQK
jgi:hypothetical protein